MADPLFCPWLINTPCLKSEIWAAWAQALLSGVGIIAAALIPQSIARRDKQDRFYAVLALMLEAAKRMHLIADLIAYRKLPMGHDVHDQELSHLTAALDAIPAHELPEGALLFSIKGVRREVAAMNGLHRRITSSFHYSDEAWDSFRSEAFEMLEAMQPHMDNAMRIGSDRYGTLLNRFRSKVHAWRTRRAAAASKN